MQMFIVSDIFSTTMSYADLRRMNIQCDDRVYNQHSQNSLGDLSNLMTQEEIERKLAESRADNGSDDSDCCSTKCCEFAILMAAMVGILFVAFGFVFTVGSIIKIIVSMYWWHCNIGCGAIGAVALIAALTVIILIIAFCVSCKKICCDYDEIIADDTDTEYYAVGQY